ncbi:MAG: ABC transporter ATP-binding protein [Flavonifractor plautii]
MLEVEHLRFSYGAREVLRGVDLRAEPGELVFVLGANGAGKTTLFRCILGLLPGYQGCVRVDGCDVSSLAPRALAKKIAYIPQTSHMISSLHGAGAGAHGHQPPAGPFLRAGPPGAGHRHGGPGGAGDRGLRPPELRGAVRWRAAACTGGPGSGPAGPAAADG